MSDDDPLFQPAFFSSVFKKATDLSLTTCLDISGHGNEEIWDTRLPVMYYIMLCIKDMYLDMASFVIDAPKANNIRAWEFARYVRDNYKDIYLSLC